MYLRMRTRKPIHIFGEVESSALIPAIMDGQRLTYPFQFFLNLKKCLILCCFYDPRSESRNLIVDCCWKAGWILRGECLWLVDSSCQGYFIELFSRSLHSEISSLQQVKFIEQSFLVIQRNLPFRSDFISSQVLTSPRVVFLNSTLLCVSLLSLVIANSIFLSSVSWCYGKKLSMED